VDGSENGRNERVFAIVSWWTRIGCDLLAGDQSLLSSRPQRLARSTLRACQQHLRVFSEYVCDRRYPWVVICEREFGRGPGQLFDGANPVAHLDEFEGHPHGIRLSDSQVWRLVTGRPERLNLRLLMVLCEILGCEPGELVKRADVATAVAVEEPTGGAQIRKDLKPKPVRLKRPSCTAVRRAQVCVGCGERRVACRRVEAGIVCQTCGTRIR
jgi:Cro/C1-type HTH DNA-binding domain